MTEHVEESNAGETGIIPAYYFCLEGDGVNPGPAPGRAWRLKNPHNGDEALIRSRLPEEEMIFVTVEATGEKPTEHRISRVFDGDGLDLAFEESTIMENTVTWLGGLSLPTAWFLKSETSAVTEKDFDPLNGQLKMSLRLAGFSGDKFKLPDWSPLPRKEGTDLLDSFDEKDVVRIQQKITSEKTGVEIVSMNLYFAHGRGIIRASGKIITKNVNYHLKEILD
ncbi:MAG: hypothetical protein HKN23_09645 [Verrucomicrobiales bacterium]|nr:hypothetical protein [Verrucomicrobiales bacterium]